MCYAISVVVSCYKLDCWYIVISRVVSPKCPALVVLSNSAVVIRHARIL